MLRVWRVRLVDGRNVGMGWVVFLRRLEAAGGEVDVGLMDARGERGDGGIRWDGGCQLATWLACISGDVYVGDSSNR